MAEAQAMQKQQEREAQTMINKVTAKGFKSFRDRTAVPFYQGLTAIVGENGNGKSNLIEALSFVFGRRSSRLRAEKLTQLIFNGGENGNPSDYAQVDVYLDNSSGIFDEFLEEDKDEIKVSRKITQAGSSIYKFEGSNCKRRKIDRIAAEANIDPDGYHFVRQGKVKEIVNESDQQRREIIDDLSGISEFDDKLEDAQEDLEEIEERLSEKEILLKEKKKQLEKLKEEKELALEYRKLEEKKKKIEQTLLEVRKRALSEQLANINTDVDEKEDKIEELEEDLKEIDDKIEEKQEKMEELEDEMTNNDIQHLESRIEKKKGEIENKKQRIQDLQSTIEDLEKMQQRANTGSKAVDAVLQMDNSGIHGAFQDLISVDDRYAVAIETAAGGHLTDVVVNDKDTAMEAINYLKRENIGRARMLPLDKIKDRSKSAKSKMAKKRTGVIGFASELVEYNSKYETAINHVFSDTLIAEDLETVKDVDGVRVVTLDGDIMSRGGAMTGGRKKKKRGNKNRVSSDINPEKKKNEKKELEREVKQLQKDVAELKQMKKKKENDRDDQSIREKRQQIREELDDLRDERQSKYSKKEKLKTEIEGVGSRKANLKAELQNVKEDLNKDEYDFSEEELLDLDKTPEELENEKKKVLRKQNSISPVNMRAIDDYKEKKEEFDEFKDEVSEIRQEKLEIEDLIHETEQKKREAFMETFEVVQKNFSEIFSDLFEGGEGELILEDDDINKGLKIRAKPPNKEPHVISALSGGEKTLTAIAFIFAILEYQERPFYIMDEIDAALDKTNSKKLSELLNDYASENQFIVISHNDITVRHAERAYGVSMKNGVSRVRSIEL